MEFVIFFYGIMSAAMIIAKERRRVLITMTSREKIKLDDKKLRFQEWK